MGSIANQALRAILITTSAWLLSVALCVIAGYLYISRDVSLEYSYIASQTIRDVEMTASRITATSKVLSTAGDLDCSERTRRILRGHVFENPGISDIGVYGKKGVACTAMIGMLESEAVDPETFIPFEDGGRIWRSRDLVEDDGIKPSLAVSTGRLIFFVEPFSIEDSDHTTFLWEVVYTASKTHAISGYYGLFTEFSESNGGLSGIVSMECSDGYSICVIILTPWEAIFAQHFPTLLALSLITLFLGFSFSALIRWMLNRSSSPTSRTLAAVNKGLFHCAYQPIINIETGEIAGCEILARLEDRYGTLSPVEFIPIVAQNKLINEFSKMMFDRAYSGIRELPWTSTRRFKLSFNLFPANLNPNMVDFFKDHPALKDEKIQVCLEITEDSSISDLQYRETIEQLNRLGIEISVDDFGTGYGNMSRLQSSHLSYLKVDKSLVSHLTPDNVKDSLTSYIPLIADNAGLKIVAEGIETEDNLAAVRSLKIRYGQGYLFSKPLPVLDFIDLIESGENWGEPVKKGIVIELAERARSTTEH